MKRIVFFLFPLLFWLSCKQEVVVKDFSYYVNPFIGTGGHGHTYPGASVPFGMMQLSPDTRLSGWDGCSGYHYSDSVVFGFSHTHLSGTGISDYGDILFMPTVGKPQLNSGSAENRSSGYCSLFSHSKEKAQAGYYETFLDDYNINVELTVTERAGMHKYRFPKSESANIILDLAHRDKVLNSYLKINSFTEIEGYRRSSSWAKDQRIYFVAQFSKPFKAFGMALNDSIQNHVDKLKGKDIKAFFTFNTAENEDIQIRIGISAVDIDGARQNLETEILDWNFEAIKRQARDKWNQELSKIAIESTNEKDKVIFYTALYHSFLSPNIYMDVDGRYRGTDLKIHKAKGFTNYTVFSLWDTYRATHPLFTLVQQDRTNDFINTFLAQYENGGYLPMWELAGNYTHCMIGYHAAPVIADAYLKGIDDFDDDVALEAMMKSAEQKKMGLNAYRKYGFIPLDEDAESVSKTLEYAYDDWTIAQMAKEMREQKIYSKYIKRAQYYKNIFDKKIGFVRPKMNASWLTPFDPREVNFNFTEANAWQYNFSVPQDINGLMKLMGGPEYFHQKLDKLFSDNSGILGREQADITGLIGQYAHGNEPSHHLAYLYNFVGKPWKSQILVHHIMDEMYTAAPDGLIGNEDCGQMSSWYVLSSMGFYQVTPGSQDFIIGTPHFEKLTLYAGRKPLVIKANNLSKENFYIQSVTLNGEEYTKSYISYKTLLKGGELTFEMGGLPNMNWGRTKVNRPISAIEDNLILPVPYFKVKKRTFYDTLHIEMGVNSEKYLIFYTTDGSSPSIKSKLYTDPFTIKKSTIVKAIAVDNTGKKSLLVAAKYLKIPKHRKIYLLSKYNKQYTAGGNDGLIDFIRGGNNFTNGSWQGFQNQDFEAIIRLENLENVSELRAGFLQDIASWIWMPTKVDFWASTDSLHFEKLGRVSNIVSDKDYSAQVMDFVLKINPRKTKFIKIKAYNYGKIPKWHLGSGGDAFIFIDEIGIK